MVRYFVTLMLVSVVVLTAGGISYGAQLNDEHQNSQNPGPASPNVVVQWNRTILVIVRTPGAQPSTVNPTRSFAIMHAAIYDAVNAIDRRHKPYSVRLTGVSRLASQDAAAASAAHEVLAALYPKFQAMLDTQLQQSLAGRIVKGGLMTTFSKRSVSWMFFVLPLFAMLFSPSSSAQTQDQETQVIELAAKKYEYSPSPVHVKAGTKVQLKIAATDHDHGFKIAAVPDGSDSSSKPGLVFASSQECWQLKKGETTTIEFLTQTPGTYTFKCCHTCGLGHRGMKGQIIVDAPARRQ